MAMRFETLAPGAEAVLAFDDARVARRVSHAPDRSVGQRAAVNVTHDAG
jgi:hypothetical protein